MVYLREKIAQLTGLVDAIEHRGEFVRSYMLKDSLRNTKKTKRAKLFEQVLNYKPMQALDSQIIQLEGLMRDDKDAVLEMNNRILKDLQKVEMDRSTQIKKLIFSYAQALAENSQRVK